ncbi:hypothetical protein CGZ91_09455 [Parenemella sanctibonifatiensis]|uniref:Putative zinc-finger domain-containing protein n=1 Tax=Parenemella sanctibonifatiensis TaxID=2016505 RepID=A0A255EET0_9ACTN|nr:hypothetical protein CGZ91_09455 [Parenemella sanctibonifatiensis]
MSPVTPSEWHACDEWVESLSPWLDHSLHDADAVRVSAHLVSCEACRAEVAELRRVRETVASGADSSVPGGLDLSRLTAIAGASADAPLYTRAFDGPGTGGRLPSTRRQRYRQVTGATLIVVGLMMTFVSVGWLAAPRPVEATDPLELVRQEYPEVQRSALTTPGRTAAMMLSAGTAQRFLDPLITRIDPQRWHPTGAALRGPAAWQVLERAQTTDVSYSGSQVVRSFGADGVLTVPVQVHHQAGDGTFVAVGGHHPVFEGMLPAREFDPKRDTTAGAELTAWRSSDTIAGRSVDLVEARSGSMVWQRWWLDARTGLVLWQEAYDGHGRVHESSGFTSIRVTTATQPLLMLPPNLSVRPTLSLPIASAQDLRRAGWNCEAELRGLPLQRLRVDDPSEPGLVASVYGSALSTVTVFQQRGVLEEPEGMTYNPDSMRWTSVGLTTTVSWQSGDQVFTVVTDGPPWLVAELLDDLPKPDGGATAPAARVLSGWEHIADVVGIR